MNKPNTPKSKPPKASKPNNNTAKVSRYIAEWNPAREVAEVLSIDSTTQAGRLFEVLSKGHKPYRMDADKYGFVKNCSLHSHASTVEKLYDLPVQRERVAGTKFSRFSFSQETIEAIADPVKRLELANTFRKLRESKMLENAVKVFKRCLLTLIAYPPILKRNANVKTQLVEIRDYINIILKGHEE